MYKQFPSVYPALSEGSRNEWLALSQKHRDGILTKKGFEKRQKKILIREGLHKEEKESNKQATISPVATNSIDKGCYNFHLYLEMRGGEMHCFRFSVSIRRAIAKSQNASFYYTKKWNHERLVPSVNVDDLD